MAIEVGWADDAQTIILLTFGETFTWDEYWQAVHQRDERVAQVAAADAVVIYDVTRLRRLPASVLAQYPRFAAQSPAGAYTPMIVGAAGYTRSLAEIYARTYRTFTMHETLAEALEALNKRRSGAARRPGDAP
ncbi:MAG: hypothetical protein Kow00124_29790 [Anaerolineae bacterium]